mgnify:CR=1 FL=1
MSSVYRFPGGIHPQEGVGGKAATAGLPIVEVPQPSRVAIPLQQHIGAPCTPTVKVGDTVAVGQVVGDSDKFVSAPIHASISGIVTAVGDVKLANGLITKGVTIKSDGEMRVVDGLTPPVVNSKEDLIAAVRASGLVGLGGAGFPCHVKLSIPPDKPVDTLIVNAAECEPYITVDYRECLEHAYDILGGINVLKKFFGFSHVIIAVEDNKPAAIKKLSAIADEDLDAGNIVRVMTLRSRYPQGAEKMMVLSATGRRVPPGKLPADVGCMVMNVASVAFISRYLKTGKPLVSRSVTVDGSAVAEPMNLRVPIGTSLSDIVDFCGGFKTEPRKIISGGPSAASTRRSASRITRCSPSRTSATWRRPCATASAAAAASRSAR